jgi:hypothetical protein
MSLKPMTEAQKAVLNAAAKKATAGGIGSLASIYPAPSVQPVDTFGVLHPDSTGVDNVEIVVDYPGMPNNDILSFYWNGDLSIAPMPASTKPTRVKVPAGLVIAAAGKTINVIYSVTDDANPNGIPSDVHLQVIDTYTLPVYPKPVITEAQAGELNVSALIANANMTLAAWPGQSVGQKLWLSVVSTPPITLQNWNPLEITTLGIQSRVISLALLQTLTNASTLTLKLEASFDGGATRFPFSEQSYTIKSAPEVSAVTITRVTGSSGVLIPNGGTTTDTTVTVEGTVTSA